VAWRTLDVGRGKLEYRVWCGICGQDWTEGVALVGRRVAAGAGRPGPVSAYCECGSAIQVVPFGVMLKVDDPLRFVELVEPEWPEQRDHGGHGVGAAFIAPTGG